MIKPVFAAVLLLFSAHGLLAQELQPRRWTHLPVGANYFGATANYIKREVFLDPTIDVQDVSGDIYTTAFGYSRTLDVYGKSGRIDVVLPYSSGRWEGIQQGVDRSTRRRGLSDPKVRFALNFYGSPAQRGEEFRRYKPKTIVGAAVLVTVPAGYYNEDKAFNISGNRWEVRPQLGVVRSWDKWELEGTASAWFFESNTDFFGGRKLEQDPVYALQSHLIYTFRPGLWASLSAAYGTGGQSIIDEEKVGERVKKILWAGSFGVPINRKQGLKFAYLRGDTRKDTGADDDWFQLSYLIGWGGD